VDHFSSTFSRILFVFSFCSKPKERKKKQLQQDRIGYLVDQPFVFLVIVKKIKHWIEIFNHLIASIENG
jgi:hypothetical protein